MLVRLRDFAELHRISERTVQVHIKNNEEELAGHIDRRGKQGTWLDEFAVNFLLDRIQLPTKDEVLMPTPREAALLMQLSEANKKLADAERRAGENAEAAGKVLFLEASQKAQEDKISQLSHDLGIQSEKAAAASRKAAEAVREAAEATDACRRAKEEKEAWVRFAAALEVYDALPWWRRRKAERPLPPIFDQES